MRLFKPFLFLILQTIVFLALPFNIFSQEVDIKENKDELKVIENIQGIRSLNFEEIKVDILFEEDSKIISPNITSSFNNPDSVFGAGERNANKSLINFDFEPKKFQLEYFKDENLNKNVSAAPVNDDICSATSVAVDGTCLNGQTNDGAGSDYYGGCIQQGHPSVFYTFTITGSNDWVRINLNDLAPASRETELMLFSGTCASPIGLAAQCETAPITNTINFDFYNLSAGTYYLYVSTQPGAGNTLTNFDICVTQGVAPDLITGPEQDCAGAWPVCRTSFSQDVSYTGYWDTDELPNYATCLLGGEHNSVWYTFTPQTSGDLAFSIVTSKDYDWALYNLTAIGGCDAIPTATPVLCNYSDNYGTTGTTLPVNATTPRSEAWNGSETMPGIPVTAGTTYVLLVDNYTGDITGYDLNFATGGGTASIADEPPTTGAFPEMTAATTTCGSNIITVDMSELIKCLSIRQSDFVLTKTVLGDYTSAITLVEGVNCSTESYTSQIQITHNGTLPTGTYTISLVAGRVLRDICDNLADNTVTVQFDYLGPLTLTPSSATICYGNSVTLTATGANGYNLYTLNPGGITDADNPDDGIFAAQTPTITTIYTVSATFGGCTRTASTTVTVEGNIITTIDPPYKTICSGTTTLTANTTINGVACGSCDYTWSTTEITQSINVGAGTYTVTVNTASTCGSGNVPSATVAVVSAGTGGGSCDVLYVSPAGGGDGYSKDAPTTLSDAITKAQCTNAIIKMQIGIYNFSVYQNINDYVTIEGGFSSDFLLKYSDLSGGTNSTTIRRDNTADSGDATKCSAFVAGNGTNDFRIQDIRIEMPGSASVTGHTAGSGVANYGIRLGTGCSDYNIIRCYIDAGVGAAP